ncbi:cysteine peptidase family C39 domain-containing protein [Egbenema bharatensis]|uniref:cysteine peptidase family C39 domain-containing protein n=1 Tax=Egbenema bharatensis TaxID=3463334 RepID=UPI003A83EA74
MNRAISSRLTGDAIVTMWLEATFTVLLGILAFRWGNRIGRFLLRKGATADNLFKGKTAVSMAFLGLYIAVLLLALYVPQFQGLPIEWRVYGMQVTWTLMRVILLGFCGLAYVITWNTARMQVFAVFLLGLLGLGGFTAAEAYFLAPIHASLHDNLLSTGIYRQTSNSSCAPSALANVLRQWGIEEATESSVARLAGTSRLGTSMPQVIVAAQGFGMDAIELHPTWEQMRQINRPGVLASWLLSDVGKNAHAIALLGMTEDTVIIADSAFGEIFAVPQSQFEQIWRQEYVPIFPHMDVFLTSVEAAQYLHRLGYLPKSAIESFDRISGQFKSALQQFQQDMDVKPTGELNPETALLLMGPFLSEGPTLEMWSQEEIGNP